MACTSRASFRAARGNDSRDFAIGRIPYAASLCRSRSSFDATATESPTGACGSGRSPSAPASGGSSASSPTATASCWSATPTARRQWDLPGGTARRGEPPAETARREMAEELGVDARWTGRPRQASPGGSIAAATRCTASTRRHRRPEADRSIWRRSMSVRWFSPDRSPAEHRPRYSRSMVALLNASH